jgi:hypothetical protein
MYEFSTAVLILLIGIFLLFPSIAYGQESNESRSMVDKLIEDTKKVESYKAELINRIQNSNCTQNFVPGLSDNERANLFPDDAKKFNDSLLNPDIPMPELASFRMPFMSIEHLEEYLKECVVEGWIK